MNANKKKRQMRLKRHRHIRKRMEGTPQKPRLCVYRSNEHIYAQVIDDWSGNTLTSISTLSNEVKDKVEKSGKVDAANTVGSLLGRKCLDLNIRSLVFDRGGYKYHGRVKALADGVRKTYEEEGIKAF